MPGTYPFNLGIGGSYLQNMKTYLDEIWRILGVSMGDGRVFFVNGIDGVGSDSYAGIDPTEPKLTLTDALVVCVSNRHDVIIVLDYWQPTGEVWPISVDKHQVHIVGLAQSGLPYPAIHPPTDVDAFQLTSSGQYGSIGRLTIGGGATAAGIEIGASGQVDGFHIHDCVFGHRWFGTPLNGIRQQEADTRGGNGNVIERCHFIGDHQGKGTISGNAIDLLVSGALDRTFYQMQIRDNVFAGITGVAINEVRCNGGEILRNKFIVPDAANGEAISLLANSLGVMVDDNVAMNGMLAAGYGFNPYRDLAANVNNHWGRNYRGPNVIEPVGV